MNVENGARVAKQKKKEKKSEFLLTEFLTREFVCLFSISLRTNADNNEVRLRLARSFIYFPFLFHFFRSMNIYKKAHKP